MMAIILAWQIGKMCNVPTFLVNIRFCLAGALFLAMCGCNSNAKHSVQGTIQVSGQTPANGIVTLTNGKISMSGKVRQDGSFIMQLGPNHADLAGEYRVLLNPPIVETITDPTNGEIRAVGKIDDKLFPLKYRVIETSDAIKKLNDGDNTLVIQLN
jgi:hypothetical protein